MQFRTSQGYSLNWIKEEDFLQATNNLLLSSSNAVKKARQRRKVNVVDPFASLLMASTFKLTDPNQLNIFQDAESGMRAIGNSIGQFHQSILGSVDGWDNHDAGYDLECQSAKIIAEVKNKHNTMNATNRSKVEDDLITAIRQKKELWKAYLVFVIPKRPVRKTVPIRNNLYQIDGASFYHLATGKEDALHDLFDTLCEFLSPSDEICTHCKEVMTQSIPPREQSGPIIIN